MKSFSLLSLLLAMALVAVMVCLYLVRSENIHLKNEAEQLNKTLTSYESLADYNETALLHSRIGTALLYRMAVDDTNKDLVDFLDTIPPGLLSCNIMDLEDYPEIQLVSYYQNRKSDDGTWLPLDRCKSASIIIETNTCNPIDYKMNSGFSGVSRSLDNPYEAWWDLPSGRTIRYQVLKAGFKLKQ